MPFPYKAQEDQEILIKSHNVRAIQEFGQSACFFLNSTLLAGFIFLFFFFAIDEDAIQFSVFDCVCMVVKCSQVMGKRKN